MDDVPEVIVDYTLWKGLIYGYNVHSTHFLDDFRGYLAKPTLSTDVQNGFLKQGTNLDHYGACYR